MESDNDGASCPEKPSRMQDVLCIICSERASITDLASPRDKSSWQTLFKAADIRRFEPITKYAQQEDGTVPLVYYHRKCRNTFTLKKTLAQIQKNNEESSLLITRKSSRAPTEGASRVYEKVCIFCQKSTKYLKSRHNQRDKLTQCCELRADMKIRNAAHQQGDERIINLLRREIVAAEAHYHRSCYRNYTKTQYNRDTYQRDSDPYTEAEHEAYQMLFSYIRDDLFSSCRVIRMTDLTCQLMQYLQSLGIDEIKASTKKHMRRKLESEFGDSLYFIVNDDGKLLVMPDNLTREELAKQNIALMDKINKYEADEDVDNILERAANHLKDEVKASKTEKPWPPFPEELDRDYLPLPDKLTKFYRVLLSTPKQSYLSARRERMAHSFAQDCVYGITGGTQMSSKHILIPWAVKTLTGNGELIKGLNRCGYGISYSKLLEIDTALALQKLAIEDDIGFAIPSNILPGIPTTLGYDNIDRREETLSGGGTSHRVNGIAVQQKVPTVQQEKVAIVMQKDKRRSIDPTSKMLPPYNAGEKSEPPVIETLDIDVGSVADEAQLKNLVWSLVRQNDAENQKISAWTGHNIQTRDKISVTPDSIGYLPTINAPATQMSTCFEILNQVLKIMELLHLPSIVCVFDQAMYEKAIDVSWRHAERFKHIVFRMGVFHTCCNLMGTIGKRFQDAGLRDMAVESGIIAEGSVDNVMSGKMYNRAVRFHKLMYEALMRLSWKGFYPWLEEDDVTSLPQLRETIRLIEELHEDVSQDALDNVLKHPACQYILQKFSTYLGHLRNSNGALSKFWMSYVDMVDILLGLIRASREGNWLMHMAFIRKMIPWCFAYDKRNYAKYLTVYYGQMTRLRIEHPQTHDNLMDGGFSVQLGDRNPFGRIPVDQIVEETVNKDTQTAGGTKGFSLKPGAVSKYYLTAEHRSASLRQFREMIDAQQSAFVHPDLQPSRIKTDEAAVKSLLELMEDNWTNPLDNEPSDLISISTGKAAQQEIADDIFCALEKGEHSYNEFKEKRMGVSRSQKFHDTLPRQNLKTFSNMKEQKTTGKSNKETVLKADHKLFGRMVLVATGRNLHMKDVLQHPLGPLPWALANCDGTLKKTNKASLARHLEKMTSAADEIPQPSVCLIDGMSLVQKTRGEHKTFGDVSEHVLMSALNIGRSSSRVDVVFDVYKDTSIKNAERINRGSGVLFTNISRGHKIQQWRRLLSCSASKASLIKFFYTDWQRQAMIDKLGDKEVYVTSEESCIRISRNGCTEVPSLQSSQEEADTRLFLHAKHAATNYNSAVIIAEDTDVLILCLAFSRDIPCNIYMKCGTQSRTRYINITKLSNVLGVNACKALLGLHAFTGCDSVSAFAGKGKVSGLKLMLKNPTFQELFGDIGKQWSLTDDNSAKLQEFTCRLYAGRSTINTVNDLRYQLFRAKKGEVESGQLPPCEDCLTLHAQRANYQAAIWFRSLQALPDTPSPNGHGWTVRPDGSLVIKWMNGEPAPDAILEFLSCKCPRVCKLPQCVCLANGMSCTDMCRLATCDNMKQDDDAPLDISEEEEDEDDTQD